MVLYMLYFSGKKHSPKGKKESKTQKTKHTKKLLLHGIKLPDEKHWDPSDYLQKMPIYLEFPIIKPLEVQPPDEEEVLKEEEDILPTH